MYTEVREVLGWLGWQRWLSFLLTLELEVLAKQAGGQATTKFTVVMMMLCSFSFMYHFKSAGTEGTFVEKVTSYILFHL